MDHGPSSVMTAVFLICHTGRRPGIHHAMFVYILCNRKQGALYIGVTNDLIRRVYEHKMKAVPSFTSRYGIDRLVYFEQLDDPENAIRREKLLKDWNRAWKIRLIQENNPDWDDLYPGLLR
jgi:putative endonuclease